MSETMTNSNTRKTLSKNQYTNMGKLDSESEEKKPDLRICKKSGVVASFSVTSQEKRKLNIEKSLSAEQKQLNLTNPITQTAKATKAVSIMTEVLNARDYIIEEISASFDKKLEKLDEAIVELISAKTENERLKGKIDNLTRENYRLKKEIESFKSIMPGVFIKVKKETISL